MSIAVCPSRGELERLFLGGIPETEVAAMEQHVQDCDACAGRLAQAMAAKDTLVESLGRETLGDDYRSSPQIADLVKQLKRLRPTASRIEPKGSAMITISCGSCQKKLSVKEELAGKKVKCPGCGSLSLVPVRAPVAVGGGEEQRTVPPTVDPDQPTIAPARQAQVDRPTVPPQSTPDATLGAKAAEPDDTSLTDFLAPAQADDELGRLGEYRILKILGHGGMGVVFMGEDVKLGRKVAIKAMLPHLAQSKSSQQRFMREAKAAAALEHDHIVPIFHVSEDRGAPYIVMPLLKGEPLDERLKREDVLPLAETLRIGREVAKGLDIAHQAGMVHRDIKPANIWLEAPEARVKILDFGLARAASQDSGLTQQGAVIGTPAYMAPEQARGDTVDARCDLFSLGVVLYRLTTGQQPFQAKDTVSTLMAVAMNDPAPPSKIKRDIPAELSELIMRLLEKDVARRVASASEVVSAIQSLERNQKPSKRQTDTVATPTKGSSRGSKTTQVEEQPVAAPRKRRPVAIFAIAAIACLGFLGLIGAGGIVYYIQTNNGVVRIDVGDHNIKVNLKKDGLVVTNIDKKEIKVSVGEYGLHIQHQDLEFDTDKFILKRGDIVTLKIDWIENSKLQVVRDGKVIGEKTLAKSTPLDPAWLKKVAAMKAQEQVDVVVAKLKDLNPGFDGKVTPTYEKDVVTELSFQSDNVKDISPLRALTGLQSLNCSGSAPGLGKVADLSPLKDMKLIGLSCNYTKVSDLTPLQGMKLVDLRCFDTRVSDLSPLKGMKLTFLHCSGCKELSDLSPVKDALLRELYCSQTKIGDLSPLRGMPLSRLSCDSTQVSDLSPLKGIKLDHFSCRDTSVSDLTALKGMKLQQLSFDGTKVTDLSPLQDLPLQGIYFEFKKERDAKILRSIASLKTINGKSASEFWTEQGYITPTPLAAALDLAPGSVVTVPGFQVPREGDLTIEAYVLTRKTKFNQAEPTFAHIVGQEGTARLQLLGGKWHAYLFHRGIGNQPATLNQWTHIAAVRTEKQRRFYVNGQLNESVDISETRDQPSDAPFQIGDKEFDGSIYEIRVSKSARYDKNFSPKVRFDTDADTLALYHCDEGTGNQLTDSSANKHHGKIVGAKWVKADRTSPPIATESQTVLRFETMGPGATCPVLVPKEGPFTIEAYVALSQSKFQAERVLLGCRYVFSLNVGKEGQFSLWGGEQGTYSFANAKTPVQLDRRYHVACVRTDKDFLLYVDGKLAATNKAVAFKDGTMQIGAQTSGDFFDIRISNTARYTADFAPAPRLTPDKDTIAFYRCDEGQGETLNDSSGNKTHGKIGNGVWGKAQAGPATAEEIAAAEWVLSKNGFVTVRVNGTDVVVNRTKLGTEIDQLPKAPYTIVGVNLIHAKTKEVKDDDLRKLTCLKQLESLDVGNHPITTDGLAHVAGCVELKALGIYYTRIDSQAIPIVLKFKRLEKFMFNNVDFPGADKWAEALAKLGTVREVIAYRTDLTDVGVGHLARLPRLESLTLDDVTLTNASLKSLATCKSLRKLDLGGGLKATLDDVRALKQALPECQIQYQGKQVVAEEAPLATPRYALQYDGKSKVEAPTLILPLKGPLCMEAYLTLSAPHAKATRIIGTGFQYNLFVNDKELGVIVQESKGATAATTALPAIGRRFHVAAVKNETHTSLFIDGKRVAQVPNNEQDLRPTKSIFAIGVAPFVGLLEEVRISSVARYDKDFIPAKRFTSDKDTLALYHFDEGKGNELKDSSDKNHHGTIVGAKWVTAPAIPASAEEIAAAEWVLSKNGFVTVRIADKDVMVNASKIRTKVEKLPDGPYSIVGIDLSPSSAKIPEVTDDDLKRLACLKQLESLDLNLQPITAAGFAHFADCRELKSLKIYSTKIGPDGISTLSRFTRLEKFMMRGDHDTNEDTQWAEAIAKLPMVKDVLVYRSTITEKGVTALATLPRLEKLSLHDTHSISDACIDALAGCKSLRHVSIDNTKITLEGARKLKKALPECKVEFERKIVTAASSGPYRNDLGMEFVLVPQGKSGWAAPAAKSCQGSGNQARLLPGQIRSHAGGMAKGHRTEPQLVLAQGLWTGRGKR